jgi:hypothetical protein
MTNVIISNLRLPHSGRPGSRLYFPQEQGSPVTPPALKEKSKLNYDRRSVSVRHSSWTRDQFLSNYFLDRSGFVDVWRPLWREVGYVVFNCYWTSPAQSFSGLNPTGLMSIFCCLYFWASPNLESQVAIFISSKNRVSWNRIYITTNGQSASISRSRAPIWNPWRDCFLLSWQLRVPWCRAPALTRRWVCNLLLQLLLVLARAVTLGSKSAELTTIYYCIIWDSKSLYLYPSGTEWPRYTPGH